jgi:CBS domain-containing protein
MARTVREVMTGDPVCLSQETTLDEAARRMADRDIGDVLVTDRGSLRGLVTDRDIVVRALARGRDPARTTLGEIVSGDVVTVEPDESVVRAVDVMRERAVRRLPVCEGDRPVGVVTIADIAQAVNPRSVLADISAAPPNR